MTLIDRKYNTCLGEYENTYLANTLADVDLSKVDPDCVQGSLILVISEGAVYIKNTEEKWQKSGSTEVLK